MIRFYKGAMIIRVANYFFTWSIYGEVNPRRYNLPRFYWFITTDLGDRITIDMPADIPTETVRSRAIV